MIYGLKMFIFRLLQKLGWSTVTTNVEYEHCFTEILETVSSEETIEKKIKITTFSGKYN